MPEFATHLRAMAAYNRWANRRLYDAASALPDEEYRRPAGVYFGSLHGTLNHLLVVDRLWLRSGRVLEVHSTQPGLQFYSGNFLDGTYVGKKGHLYRMGDGIALEPQKFPDSPNKPNFVSARVDPGKPYHHEMVYRLSVAR